VLGVIDVEGNVCADDCTLSGKVAAQRLASFLGTGFPALVDEIRAAAQQDQALQDFSSSLRLCDPRALHRHAVELVDLSVSETLAGRLGALEVPTFYIAGSPGGAGARSRGLLEQAGVRCTVISPAGHAPFMDQPDAFAQAVASMAGECPGTGPGERVSL
jgi:pimeloyl-ACP methyl ester carboxylesterase